MGKFNAKGEEGDRVGLVFVDLCEGRQGVCVVSRVCGDGVTCLLLAQLPQS